MKLAALIFSAVFYLWLALAMALSGCAIGRAWEEADWRARLAPIAREVKP